MATVYPDCDLIHSTLNCKPNALCKGQRGTGINRVGRSAHVALPGIRARLAAATRLLFAANAPPISARRADVYICDAAVRPDGVLAR